MGSIARSVRGPLVGPTVRCGIRTHEINKRVRLARIGGLDVAALALTVLAAARMRSLADAQSHSLRQAYVLAWRLSTKCLILHSLRVIDVVSRTVSRAYGG